VTRGDATDGDGRDTDRGYTIEMAIPFSALSDGSRPAHGVRWTFGVFRYDYTWSYENPLLLRPIPESPGHGFYCYEAYQPLVFEHRRQ